MVFIEEVELRFKAFDDVRFVQLLADGTHYQLTVVSDRFKGQSKVVRQQWVYSQVSDHISSGKIHALHMNTWTNDEWEKEHG
ncbi:MAG: BolA/IbaG family iron-sulfur metabolism protein [Legionellaceae bacterium]